MSENVAVLDSQQAAKLAAETLWQRVTFAGIASGNPPCATFHAAETLRNGAVKHFSQAVSVADESVLLRLMRLPVGTELRVCIQTDWSAPDLATTLLDFCTL